MQRMVKSYSCRLCQNLCEPALDQLCLACREETPQELPEVVKWEKLGGGVERCMVSGGWLYSRDGAICFVPDATRGG
jgi:hypothetical protein